MHHSILRRTIVRLRRSVHLCLPALALALTHARENGRYSLTALKKI
jgi:hypothetical protein